MPRAALIVCAGGGIERLGAELAQGGFDAAALAAAAQTPRSSRRLPIPPQQRGNARVFGIPTWFVGDEIVFDKECLAQIGELLTP